MIGTILTIIWIVSAVWVVIVMPIYYLRESRHKNMDDELAEACRYYMEKHPEVPDPYRTKRHKESEGKDGRT